MPTLSVGFARLQQLPLSFGLQYVPPLPPRLPACPRRQMSEQLAEQREQLRMVIAREQEMQRHEVRY